MKKACSNTLFSKFGFTIIELLVSMSIIGIVFGVGVAAYTRFNRQQILFQAAQDLKSNLRLAQDKALAGEKDCSPSKCGGSDGICGTGDANERKLDGWYISFTENGYQIYGRCEGQTFGPPAIDLTKRSITIDSPPPKPIRFKPLGQGVEEATTITLSGTGGTEKVTVTETGEIR